MLTLKLKRVSLEDRKRTDEGDEEKARKRVEQSVELKGKKVKKVKEQL